MTPRERVLYHRRAERVHVRSARYCIGHGDYAAALRDIGWALQQQTAADAAASTLRDEKLKEAAVKLERVRGKARKRAASQRKSKPRQGVEQTKGPSK